MSTIDQATEQEDEGVKRRDFLFIAATGFGAVAAAGAAWPLIDNMNPSADVLALGSIEVDLSQIEEGQEIKVKWRGKPVFIRHHHIGNHQIALSIRHPGPKRSGVAGQLYFVPGATQSSL